MSITDQSKVHPSSAEGIVTLAKGTTLSFFGEVGRIIITYVYGIVIARFMGASNFGIFFLGITIFNLLALFSYCGIEDGLMRFLGPYIVRGEQIKAKRVIRFSLLLVMGLGTLLGGICFISADFLAKKLFHKPELGTVLHLLSLSIPLAGIMVVSVASMRGFRIIMPYVLVRKIFMPLISFVLAIAVLAMGYGLRGLTVAHILALGCSAVLAISFLNSFLSPFTRGANSSPERNRYFSFISSAFLVNILVFFIVWNDLIILAIFQPSKELGIYFAAKKTALMLSFLLMSLNVIFIPTISHLHSSREYKQLDQAFKSGTQWLLMLGLPLFLIISFFSREILLLFGPAFEASKTCLIILAFGQIVNISVGSVGYLLMMTRHQNWMIFNSILFAILSIFLVLLLVPRYGLLGAAWANGLSIALANVVAMIEVYFLLQLHPYNTRYFKILCSGAITAAVIYIVRYYLPNNGSLLFLLTQVFLVFSVFFVLVILFGLQQDERRFLMAIKDKLTPSYIQESFGGKR